MTDTASPVRDPLDGDLSTVDTSFPLLKQGKGYRFEIRRPEVIAGKKEGEQNLHFQACTTQPAKGTKGEDIHIGFPVHVYIGVTVTEDRTPEDIKKRIAQVVKATGKKGLTVPMILSNPSVLEGAIFDATVKISPAKDGYNESNAIGTYVPAS